MPHLKVDVKPLVCLFCTLLLAACGSTRSLHNEDTLEQSASSAREVALPAFPKQENLIEFYAGELTSNLFYIDPLSLHVDKEGIVRYTMVVKTSGGATNISFEGIRCDTRQFRLFAIGRSDGIWSRARTSEWREIENKVVNRHHAALNRDYLCPGGSMIADAAEGIKALRRGRQPEDVHF